MQGTGSNEHCQLLPTIHTSNLKARPMIWGESALSCANAKAAGPGISREANAITKVDVELMCSFGCLMALVLGGRKPTVHGPSLKRIKEMKSSSCNGVKRILNIYTQAAKQQESTQNRGVGFVQTQPRPPAATGRRG